MRPGGHPVVPHHCNSLAPFWARRGHWKELRSNGLGHFSPTVCLVEIRSNRTAGSAVRQRRVAWRAIMRAVEIGRTHEPAHRHAPPRFACFSIGPDGRGHHGEFGHFPPASEHSPPRPTLRRYSGRSACASSSCQATRPRATRPSWLAAWSRFSGVGDNNVPTLHSAPAAR